MPVSLLSLFSPLCVGTTHVCVHVCMYVCMCAQLFVHAFAHVYVMHVFLFYLVCVCVCVCVCLHVPSTTNECAFQFYAISLEFVSYNLIWSRLLKCLSHSYF